MTLPGGPGATTRLPTRLPTRLRAILALGMLVLASAFAGAAVDHAVVRAARRYDALHDTTFHPLSSLLRSSTPADRLLYRRQLSDALGLTPGQDSAIDQVMAERAGKFNALRDELRPRVDSLVTDLRSGIEQTLSDRQRVAFRELQQRGREQLVSNGQAP